MKKANYSAIVLLTSTAFATGSSAVAQTAPIELELEEVVVTGSRVITNGNNSPTPITVVAFDDIQRVQPTTIADGLNLLPVFSSPRGQVSNPTPNVTGGAGGNAAANQLNLRNLGSVRNLILFDGMRVPSTATNNVVDVDTIPQMLLQRVDTVTGGVSAVYGSDAITGVVNFITDRNFNGIKVQAQGGVSEYSDAGQVNVGVAVGTKLGDRGHFEGSYEYRKDEGILQRSDRPWLIQQAVLGATPASTLASGSASNPYQLFSNVRLSATPFGGRITNGVFVNQYFATDGVLTPFVDGALTGTPNNQVGGAGGYYDASLKAPLESHQVFGRFDYDLTDDLHVYVTGLFNTKNNKQFISPPQLNNVTMSRDNNFLSPAYRAQLATGATTFTFGKLFNQAPRLTSEPTSTQYWLNGGLEGKFGDGWDWGVAYSHAQTKLDSTLGNVVDNQRLAAALDAVVNPANGQTVCYASLTNAAYADCAPLNVFGPTSASQAAIDYVLEDRHLEAHTKITDLVANISGSPFDTWAGPVNVALSGELRGTSYYATTDSLVTDRANCTGLRFNCSLTAPPQHYVTAYSNRSKVSDNVKEAAFEFDAPLLKDAPLASSLNINGAVRYTKYKISGDYTTWKIGLDWHLTEDFRIRGTRSSDIRAPTLEDLYAPTASQLIGNTDRLTNIAPVPPVPSFAQGNPKVTAEIGSTTTAGIVWNAFQGFSLAVDGYHIKITDALQNFQGFTPGIQDQCYASAGASPYCALQTRPINYTSTSAANLVTAWYQTVINIAEIESYGADVEANYATRLFEQPFSIRALASYQPHIIYRAPSLVTVDQSGAVFGPNGLSASPKLRVTAFLRYAVTDSFTVDLMQRWRSALEHSTDPTQVWVDNHVDTFTTTTVNLAYKARGMPGQPEFFLNVQNLFDAEPPSTAFYAAVGIPGQFGGFAFGDDPVGRYYTGGVRMKF
jgi:outer membrane receptor protein involved in Fe transport